MFCLISKLKSLKAKLKRLHKSEFSNIEGRIQLAKQQVIDIQHQILADSMNLELQRQEKILKQEYMELLSADETMARQRAKIDWLQQGDLDAEFFHDCLC